MTGGRSLSPNLNPSCPPNRPLTLATPETDTERGDGRRAGTPRHVRDGNPKGEDARSGASAEAESPARRGRPLPRIHSHIAVECPACNGCEQHVKWVEYVQMMQASELNIQTQQTEFDLRQADDIRINDMGR